MVNALLLFLLLLLLLFSPLIAAASCASVLLQTISTRWDSLGSTYQSEICSRGCQPVMSTWDEWTYTHAFLPLIDTMASEMALSSRFKDTFTRVGEDIASATKRECDDLLATGQHFCSSDGDKLGQWNRCFKGQAAKTATKNMISILTLVTREICKDEKYKYLQGDRLWGEVLPEYMRAYARTCASDFGNQDGGAAVEEEEEIPIESQKDEL
jgi:hypothetical protein